MSDEGIIFEKDNDGIATITLNRPEKLNAIDNEIRIRLPEMIEATCRDDEIKVLIITGAGRGFCSGADVSWQQSRLSGNETKKTRQEIMGSIGSLILPLVELDKPTIAAVNGVAAGAGLSLALACDLRIASEQAKFAALFVNRGLIPDLGATYFLPKLLGVSKALELMYTGDLLSAEESEKAGLVTKVVPHEELMTTVKETARRFARGPSVAIELMKRAVYRRIREELQSQMDFESYAQNICRQTEDHREAVKAFMEKREPAFKGL